MIKAYILHDNCKSLWLKPTSWALFTIKVKVLLASWICMWIYDTTVSFWDILKAPAGYWKMTLLNLWPPWVHSQNICDHQKLASILIVKSQGFFKNNIYIFPLTAEEILWIQWSRPIDGTVLSRSDGCWHWSVGFFSGDEIDLRQTALGQKHKTLSAPPPSFSVQTYFNVTFTQALITVIVVSWSLPCENSDQR